ncbi:YhcN/YlaJ family sporulation lipoprotein [Bacillus sp. FJAT-42315]|uniref:YhcN/YlaJ family sporulation lipoprotein n=1 Tax=Bacillus sp. FJAT-42315 TaxID=2014077 RepID=UPI000C246E40|nr:YhcN/YlaJ family sporulation lipoprotein [Bacillus sp. FJAT-42315]
MKDMVTALMLTFLVIGLAACNNDGEEKHGFYSGESYGEEHQRSTDINYHGNRGLKPHKVKSSYYENYPGAFAEKLSKEAMTVRGVTDARAFINGKRIEVAVHLKKEGKEAERIKKDVEKAVAPYTDGYQVRVLTTHSSYSHLRNLDNDLRDGGPIDLPNERFSR